jgi:putative ABC transport system substrate-binding protein
VLRGTGVPLLFCVVSDPVGAGVVAELGEPTGTNVSGRVYTVDRAAKLNLVMRLAGQVVQDRPVRFGFVHSSYPSAVGDLRELSRLQQQRGDCRFVSYRVPYQQVPAGMPAMLEKASRGAAELAPRVDFWWEPSGPLGEVAAYTKVLLSRSQVTVAMGTKLASVKLGALMHVTPDWQAGGREMAGLALQVLSGRPVGEIPVVPPATFDLGLNLDTCLKLGIVVPPEMLEMAGEDVFGGGHEAAD